MKKRYTVYINFKSELFPKAQALFRRIGRADLANAPEAPWGYHFKFEDEAKLKQFFAEAERQGFVGEDTLSMRAEHIYTPVELRAAPLLYFILRTEEKGISGPWYGIRYDLSTACPQCGSGAVQTSPLYLKPSETPKKVAIFQTMNHEYLVSLEFAEVLKKAGITGLELRQARSYKEHKPLPWMQIVSRKEMPPWRPSTIGFTKSNLESEKPCPHCNRDGYFHTGKVPLEIAYSKSQVNPDRLPDVIHTYEHFTKSFLRVPFEESHLAQPLLLVKPKVYDVFQSQKVRRVEFVPVKII